MTKNSQVLTNEPKRKEKQQKQKLSDNQTGTESEKWTSHRGSSVGRGKGGMGGKGTGKKKHN